MAARINRTHNHGEMKKASSMIANDKLPKAVQPSGRGYTTPLDLKSVANAFVRLQQARHEADYDLSRTFRKQEALAFVKLARQAFEAWGRVRRTDDARVYLAKVGWCQTLFLVLTCCLRNQKQSLTTDETTDDKKTKSDPR